MTVVSKEFEQTLRDTVSPLFEVSIAAYDRDEILFTAQRARSDKYYLSCDSLSEERILDVAKIVYEVYSDLGKCKTSGGLLSKLNGQNLNSDTVESGKFVDAVVSLDKSAFHKFLLLTSGDFTLKKGNADLLINLARIKRESCSNVADLIAYPSSTQRYYLSDNYILPGVGTQTNLIGFEDENTPILEDDSAELYLKLLAFIAKDSDTTTFGEFLELELFDAIALEKDAPYLAKFSQLKEIVLSEGLRNLTRSMTSRELLALDFILDGSSNLDNIPETFLRNRSTAISKSPHLLAPNAYRESDLYAYLSNQEVEAINSHGFDYFLEVSTSEYMLPMGCRTLIYAALAEVAVVKGPKKVLEVISELEHIKNYSYSLSPQVYNATVLLIIEGLNPEFDDYPFAWSAQLSEHGWVINSHISKDGDLSLKV